MLTGQTINAYTLGDKINEGLFGEIYQAKSPNGEAVAMKLLRASFVLDDQLRARFFREIQLLQAVQHPNIVPILDFGHQGDKFYLVMPLFEDQTLNDLLAKKRYSPLETWGFVQPIASALEAGHSQGIIHRDLKPENVLVEDKSQGVHHYYLLDFGLAKRPGIDVDITLPGTKLGTPEYIAPENVLSEGIDNRSDIYSLAVMVYELLLGILPFEMDRPTQVAMAHAQMPPPIPTSLNADFPPELERFLLKNLAKEKDKRHQSMAEFAAAYHSALLSLTEFQQKSYYWVA